ncbi:MAG: hypothetical protein M1829_005989 [Trizodia sp. TS-e1964]|nr:MAG: hypothetical protein M1829_005989 [Trizodia sp. TS-e1964]
MAKRRKPRVSSSLSAGRPPNFLNNFTPLVSAKASRTIIRSHHTLQKRLSQAIEDCDTKRANLLRNEIEAQGGLRGYQQASISGQSNNRGGDSSRILMEWLKSQDQSGKPYSLRPGDKMKMLEVGALKITNACSKSALFDVHRIDLNAQEDGIVQQCFMERPIPSSEDDKFDVISLSLVLNYVPNPATKGNMLRRTTQFLRSGTSGVPGPTGEMAELFPSLFLVLPISCVTNSRYMNEERLKDILESLGYHMVKRKATAKLFYCLWHYNPVKNCPKTLFKKTQVNPGLNRNNFAIVLN